MATSEGVDFSSSSWPSQASTCVAIGIQASSCLTGSRRPPDGDGSTRMRPSRRRNTRTALAKLARCTRSSTRQSLITRRRIKGDRESQLGHSANMRSTGLRPQDRGLVLRLSTCLPRSLCIIIASFQSAGLSFDNAGARKWEGARPKSTSVVLKAADRLPRKESRRPEGEADGLGRERCCPRLAA